MQLTLIVSDKTNTYSANAIITDALYSYETASIVLSSPFFNDHSLCKDPLIHCIILPGIIEELIERGLNSQCTKFLFGHATKASL